jgi:hypothetical protein
MAFQIQTNMKKFKHKPSSWMVIDLDHIFRRHYIGLKKYYIKNDPDKYNEQYDWSSNINFINELSKQIKNKITNLVAVNKYVQPNHVILTNEYIQSDNLDWIWRKNIFLDWTTNIYQYDPVWMNVFESSLHKFINERGYIYIQYPDTETNDIIAIIVKLIEHAFPHDYITIISQDSDFYQLINDKISVLNINGEEETSRILPSGEINLWFKIINGKKSNNVPVLKFDYNCIKKFLKDDYDGSNETVIYRELTKKELYIILHNLKDFKDFLEDEHDMVENNQLFINQQIIDYNYIPKKIVADITKYFWNKYNKHNNLFDSQPTPLIFDSLSKSSLSMTETNKKNQKNQSNNIFSILDVDYVDENDSSENED